MPLGRMGEKKLALLMVICGFPFPYSSSSPVWSQVRCGQWKSTSRSGLANNSGCEDLLPARSPDLPFPPSLSWCPHSLLQDYTLYASPWCLSALWFPHKLLFTLPQQCTFSAFLLLTSPSQNKHVFSLVNHLEIPRNEHILRYIRKAKCIFKSMTITFCK